MPLETATYINQLDAANPLGSDPIAAGDDHIRLVKATVKATFPNITGPVNLTQTQLNTLVPGAAQQADLDALQAEINADVASLGSTKADKATTITAGAGLTGGGNLSANRTISIATGSNGFGSRTVSTASPTGGTDGDIWYRV